MSFGIPDGTWTVCVKENGMVTAAHLKRWSRTVMNTVLHPAWICGVCLPWRVWAYGPDPIRERTRNYIGYYTGYCIAAIRGWSVSGPCSSLCSIPGLQAICHEQNFFGLPPCNRTSHWHLGLDIILVTWRRSQFSRQQTASSISLGCNSVMPPSWHLHLAKVQGQPHPCSGEQPLCVPAHTLCL